MPPFRKPTLITLRRHDLSHPWGFRLAGGANQGQPFHFQKVIPDSIAHKSGLQEGDLLARIGNITLKGLTHEEVQEIIMRCANTIDLFVIRNPSGAEPDSPGIMSPPTYNANYPYGSYAHGQHPRSLTEQVLNRMVEKDYYGCEYIECESIASPPVETQTFVKERDMYELNEQPSTSRSKSPQSPIQRPPPSARPFSPVVSPTNISYHQPEEQQWLSSQEQSKDARVFGANPRAKSPSPNTSPVQQKPEGQKDTRVFGLRSGRAQSPFTNGSRPTTASSATPSPVQGQQPSVRPKQSGMVSPLPVSPVPPPQPTQITNYLVNQNQDNQKPLIRANSLQEFAEQEQRFYGQPNKSPEHNRSQNVKRPERVIGVNDRRVFGNTWKQRMGGSLDADRDWKEQLPQLKTVHPEVNQLLPSHIKREQTYIVQTPPTEKNARPPPTGTHRRRIRPVWPPPDYNEHSTRSGFNRGESPSRKCEWPPSREGSVDRENYENGVMSPRMRYSTPPPGWNPRGSDSPGGRRSYTPTRRSKNPNWPPPSNATPAGPSRFKPETFTQSLPGSRRGSQSQNVDSSDFYVYIMNKRVPQTYRSPPETQYYYDQSQPASYHYDTD